MIPYCKFNGIGIIPWGPLSSGLLARPHGIETTRTESLKNTVWQLPVSEADKEILKRVEEVAKRHSKSMAQISLAWVGQKIESPIIGVAKIERLEESLLTDFKLTQEEMGYLEEPYVTEFCLLDSTDI
jgi:aryl-alcohol dehydrogenase-like predicted oxidoreductase